MVILASWLTQRQQATTLEIPQSKANRLKIFYYKKTIKDE
jgi:hypothetical protein